jgi:hypothetical protein
MIVGTKRQTTTVGGTVKKCTHRHPHHHPLHISLASFATASNTTTMFDIPFVDMPLLDTVAEMGVLTLSAAVCFIVGAVW